MIPNALADTGPYAALWGHLKSIDHALCRVLEENPQGGVTELDRDRLRALQSLITDALNEAEAEGTGEKDRLFGLGRNQSDFSPSLNLCEAIRSNDAFGRWHKPSKKPFKNGLERLTKAIDDFLAEGSLVPPLQRQEFGVLRSIVQELATGAEGALHI